LAIRSIGEGYLNDFETSFQTLFQKLVLFELDFLAFGFGADGDACGGGVEAAAALGVAVATGVAVRAVLVEGATAAPPAVEVPVPLVAVGAADVVAAPFVDEVAVDGFALCPELVAAADDEPVVPEGVVP